MTEIKVGDIVEEINRQNPIHIYRVYSIDTTENKNGKFIVIRFQTVEGTISDYPTELRNVKKATPEEITRFIDAEKKIEERKEQIEASDQEIYCLHEWREQLKNEICVIRNSI